MNEFINQLAPAAAGGRRCGTLRPSCEARVSSDGRQRACAAAALSRCAPCSPASSTSSAARMIETRGSVRRRCDAWSVAQPSEGSGLNYGRLVSLDACAGGARRCTKVRRLLKGTASWGSSKSSPNTKIHAKGKTGWTPLPARLMIIDTTADDDDTMSSIRALCQESAAIVACLASVVSSPLVPSLPVEPAECKVVCKESATPDG